MYFKGDDNVVCCKIAGDQASVEQLYNNGKEPILLDSNNATTGISNPQVSYNNGIISCSFTRQKTNSKVSNYFDLVNKEYYLLLAKGKVENSNAFNFLILYLYGYL